MMPKSSPISKISSTTLHSLPIDALSQILAYADPRSVEKILTVGNSNINLKLFSEDPSQRQIKKQILIDYLLSIGWKCHLENFEKLHPNTIISYTHLYKNIKTFMENKDRFTHVKRFVNNANSAYLAFLCCSDNPNIISYIHSEDRKMAFMLSLLAGSTNLAKSLAKDETTSALNNNAFYADAATKCIPYVPYSAKQIISLTDAPLNTDRIISAVATMNDKEAVRTIRHLKNHYSKPEFDSMLAELCSGLPQLCSNLKLLRELETDNLAKLKISSLCLIGIKSTADNMLNFLFSQEGLQLAEQDENKWKKECLLAIEIYQSKQSHTQWGKDLSLTLPSNLPQKLSTNPNISSFLLSTLAGETLKVELQKIIDTMKPHKYSSYLSNLITNNCAQALALILDNKINLPQEFPIISAHDLTPLMSTVIYLNHPDIFKILLPQITSLTMTKTISDLLTAAARFNEPSFITSLLDYSIANKKPFLDYVLANQNWSLGNLLFTTPISPEVIHANTAPVLHYKTPTGFPALTIDEIARDRLLNYLEEVAEDEESDPSLIFGYETVRAGIHSAYWINKLWEADLTTTAETIKNWLLKSFENSPRYFLDEITWFKQNMDKYPHSTIILNQLEELAKEKQKNLLVEPHLLYPLLQLNTILNLPLEVPANSIKI